MKIDENIIKKLLQDGLHQSEWIITSPPGGLSKESYIVENAKQKVFFKVEQNTSALKRLSELGITPKVLLAGRFQDEDYFVQEYQEGYYPDWKWFTSHLSLLASTFKKYHTDTKLKEAALVHPNRNYIKSYNYEDHLKEEFKHIEQMFEKTEDSGISIQEGKDLFTELKNKSLTLERVELKPVHADPNYKNFIINGDKLSIVDWDDIMISDPMNDVGLFLYQYIPVNKWKDFFQEYGLNINENLLNRIYWWASIRLMSGGLWFATNGNKKEYLSYLSYAKAAINKKHFPNAAFNELGQAL